MKVEVYSSFVRDSKKLSAAIKEEISDAISLMQNAKTFSDIPQVKAMQGGKRLKMPIECASLITEYAFSLGMKS